MHIFAHTVLFINRHPVLCIWLPMAITQLLVKQTLCVCQSPHLTLINAAPRGAHHFIIPLSCRFSGYRTGPVSLWGLKEVTWSWKRCTPLATPITPCEGMNDEARQESLHEKSCERDTCLNTACFKHMFPFCSRLRAGWSGGRSAF